MSMVPINPMSNMPATIPAPPTPLEIIAKAASDPNTDPAKLTLLWQLWEQTKRADAEKAFNQAMAGAQEEIRPVLRDSKNPNTNSRFASLESIDTAVRPIYTKHGFSLSFNSGEPRSATGVRVLCDVRHTEGFVKAYELEGELDNVGAKGAPTKTAIHGLGSSVSYLRRYLTCMIFNITLTNEDDDGNAAGGYRPERPIIRQSPDIPDDGGMPTDSGWGHSGSKEQARAKGEEIIEDLKAGRSYRGPRPSDEELLEASINKAEAEKPKPQKSVTRHGGSPKYCRMLQAFGEIKKEISNDMYYASLGAAGYSHANEFPDTARGVQAMAECLAAMREERDNHDTNER